MNDRRLAARTPMRSPGLALTAIPTVAPRIAANTAVFNVVDAVILRPCPGPDRLVRRYRLGPPRGVPG